MNGIVIDFRSTDIRPPLSLGVQLHRPSQLSLLLLLPHHPILSHAGHFHLLAALRPQQQRQASAASANRGNGFDGADFYPCNSYLWVDGLPYGVSIKRSNYQRASDREVQGRLQSFLAGLLQQLLLHPLWSTISIVSQTDVNPTSRKSTLIPHTD